MAQGPENRMLNRLKPKLERDLNLQIEKTNNAFRSGRPDWDLFGEDGNAGYIEAKHWKRQAQRGEVMDGGYIWEMASPLQQKWLIEKAALGHRCAMLCGFESRDCYAFIPVHPGCESAIHPIVSSYMGLVMLVQSWIYPPDG